MASKVRKQIYIDPDQESALKRLAKDTGISEAEIIRQAIDRCSLVFKLPHKDITAWEEERAFIQQLIEQGSEQNSQAIKRTWKREDLYDR